MIISELNKHEFEEIRTKHQTQHDFPLPDYDKFIAHAVAESDSKVVAYAGIKPIYELILSLDTSVPMREKVLAVRDLMQHGIFVAGNHNIPVFHAFVDEPNFIQMLKKSFGFRDCKGKALYLEI
jgi:hypothetical protein